MKRIISVLVSAAGMACGGSTPTPTAPEAPRSPEEAPNPEPAPEPTSTPSESESHEPGGTVAKTLRLRTMDR